MNNSVKISGHICKGSHTCSLQKNNVEISVSFETENAYAYATLTNHVMLECLLIITCVDILGIFMHILV